MQGLDGTYIKFFESSYAFVRLPVYFVSQHDCGQGANEFHSSAHFQDDERHEHRRMCKDFAHICLALGVKSDKCKVAHPALSIPL